MAPAARAVWVRPCVRCSRTAFWSKVRRKRNGATVRVFLDPAEWAIELIIHDGMSEVGKVDSNLVMTTGHRFCFDERVFGKPFNDPESSQRGP